MGYKSKSILLKTGIISYAELPDDDLIVGLRAGDKHAYTEIYNRYKNVLQNHAYKKLGDFEEVKDVLQELFTQLWVKREELQTTNLSGYLYVAIRNKIFNLHAHRIVKSKYIESLEEYIDSGNFSTDNRVREKEFTEMINKEIDALPLKMRTVFLLSRSKGFSHKEIAETLNIAEQTVSKQITNALKILRMRFQVFFFLFLSSSHFPLHSMVYCLISLRRIFLFRYG
ncbi:RNA polymerase sigma factor [Pedobacter lusitanus]|uniref:RNA polymerase sigma factor n=1 Tax=Pedobacter lusitanus TaxID=1503925 RepID=UPI0009E1C047|nr:RNA polymerase sigma-70 factor [Pedobacter lusitanus]